MPSLGRRHLLATAALSLAGSVALRPARFRAAYESPASESAWHQPRRDGGNTAATARSGPRTDGEIGWEHGLRPVDTYEPAGFARVDDAILVSGERRLVALDASSGARQWTFRPPETRRSIDSSPRVRDGTAFLSIGGNYVYAVDLESRRPRWRYRTDGSVYGLTLAGNTLCFSSYVDGDRVIALDAETGHERWRASADLFRTAASGDRLIGRTWGRSDLVALDLETGEELWRRDTENAPSLPHVRSVAGLEDRVVVGGPDRVAVLESSTGDVRTSIEGVRGSESLAVDGDAERLFVTDSYEGTVASVGLDGEGRWDRTAPVAAGLSVGGDTVYAAATDGLLALDAADGSERFAVTLQSPPTPGDGVTPLVTDGAVYHAHGDRVYEVREP